MAGAITFDELVKQAYADAQRAEYGDGITIQRAQVLALLAIATALHEVK